MTAGAATGTLDIPMPKYRYDPLAVYPTPPSFTKEQLQRRTEEMWREQLASAVGKISEADAWNARTGGTQRVTLDCLEVRALNRHFSGAGDAKTSASATA